MEMFSLCSNATAKIWRGEVMKAGMRGVYLCSVASLPELHFDPVLIGFDAAVDFQPDWGNLPPREIPLKNRILSRLMK